MKKLIVGRIRKGHETNRVVIGRANAVKLKEYYITKVNGVFTLLQRTADGLIEPEGLLGRDYLMAKGLIRKYAKVLKKLPGITVEPAPTASQEPVETEEPQPQVSSLIGE